VGTVWILGAGFSKPLGGPLLGKLLSPESERDLLVRYRAAPLLWTPEANAARWLYRYGRGGRVPMGAGSFIQGENLWDDAEQYLDYLDTAAEKGAGSPACDRLLEILSDQKVDQKVAIHLRIQQGAAVLIPMAAAARRLLAAECCAFLEGVDPDSERWSPYRRWFREVFVWGEDTVVTFNYDLVPEMLADSQQRRDLFQYRKKPGCSSLLKLHGSVNWALQSTLAVETNAGVRNALTCDDSHLAIAGPGPGKQRLSSGVFKPFWDEALAALEKAAAIVFVGYRFPPTDAEAREKLLAAIRKNKDEKHLAIHTVLGPNTSSDDSRRLRGLLEHAMSGVRKPTMLPLHPNDRCYSLWQHPLWAEDFFSIVVPRSITSPHELTLP
jgi:hypothetical protein